MDWNNWKHYKDCKDSTTTKTVCYGCFVIKNKKLANYKENEATMQAEIASLKDKLAQQHKDTVTLLSGYEQNITKWQNKVKITESALAEAKEKLLIAKQTITQRNKQIADISNRLKEAEDNLTIIKHTVNSVQYDSYETISRIIKIVNK